MRPALPTFFLVLTVLSSSLPAFGTSAANAGKDGHTNNWAVILSTSRYWFNYRHASDALSFYHIVRRLGIPDSNIILMLPDDMACNPRNPVPGQIFNNKDRAINLYGEKVEVDYRGYEVTVENFLRVLTGRHAPGVPRSKRLLSDAGSNVLVYLTGHGGDNFLKFQDHEEIMGEDIADAIAQMHEKRRYRQMVLFVETCEAETLTEKVYSPNVLTIGTSKLGEKSYSHHSDVGLGLTVTDRVTYYALQWFREHVPNITSTATLQHFLDYVRAQELDSTLVWSHKLFPRKPAEIPIMDFFGSVPAVAVPSEARGEALKQHRAAADDAAAAAADASSCSSGGGGSLHSGAVAGTAAEGESAVEQAPAAHAAACAVPRVLAAAEPAAAPSTARNAAGIPPAATTVGAAASCHSLSHTEAAAAASPDSTASEQISSAAARSAGAACEGWQTGGESAADVPLLLACAAVAAAAAAASKRHHSQANQLV